MTCDKCTYISILVEGAANNMAFKDRYKTLIQLCPLHEKTEAMYDFIKAYYQEEAKLLLSQRTLGYYHVMKLLLEIDTHE
jgi:hypothetical protein